MYFSIAFGSAMCLGIVVVACQRWRRNASGEADVFAAKITGVAARLPLLDGEAGHGAASAWAPRATLLDPPAALPQAGRGAAASGRSAAARAARAARAVPPPPQTPRAPASAARAPGGWAAEFAQTPTATAIELAAGQADRPPD